MAWQPCFKRRCISPRVLCFVVPVVVFSVAFNVPKFFEVTFVTRIREVQEAWGDGGGGGGTNLTRTVKDPRYSGTRLIFENIRFHTYTVCSK